MKCIWYNVLDVVLGLVKTAVNTGIGTDERVRALLVRGELGIMRHQQTPNPKWHRTDIITHIPEHGTAKSVVLDVLGLNAGDVGGIIRNEFLLGGVVRVTGDVGQVLKDLSTSEREGSVRVDTSFDGSRANLTET